MGPLITALAVAAAVLIAPTGAAADSVYYVAPDGNDGAAGTQAAPWRSFAHAQSVAEPGDTVYFRGGTYSYTDAAWNCSSRTDRVSAILLDKSGSSGNPITYAAHPGETPVFDFSGMNDDCRIKGIEVTASRIHLKGLEITGVPQNNDLNAENWGVWISGSYNTFEQLDIHHIMGTGLFINGGGGNLVLNSDSHENYDPYTRQGAGESSDGFGSHYVPAGSAENVFRGCRAWWNGDDGYDLISTYSPVTIENSWSWLNGYVPGTTDSAGNGAGFKIGGYGADWESGAPQHTVTGSVAFENKAQGFYANYHPVASDFFNNTAYDNHPNFSMRGIDQGGNTSVGRGTLRNNIAHTGVATDYMNGTDSAYNSWDLAVEVSDADFQSVSTDGWDAPREDDGSLPHLPHLRLAPDSDLIDAGTDVGLSYEEAAPDLGAFEFGDDDPDPPDEDVVRYEA
ncbi:right-handed parallel beta-helix repeat-containing protein, partial [Glycomyces salinus]|uniref:right-handed parallel beta-helix repeat-containing protein n=1 Tax=Glycomyces salinus TaxID=980294 RepID=UPI0018ECD7B1